MTIRVAPCEHRMRGVTFTLGVIGRAGSRADELQRSQTCYPDAVRAVRAHVRNGQIILDEPVELVEGGNVEVLLPDHDELSVEDRTELEAAVEESAAQFERGEFEDARAFAVRLLARP